MEGNVILAHELVQLDILGVLPPLLPILGISSRDRRVTDRSIKPHIKHLALPTRQGDRGTPLQVTGNTTQLESLLEPGLSDDFAVVGPGALGRSLLVPGLTVGLELAQVEEEVF